jgi:glucose/arabinose dehydrogenase
LTLVFLLGCSGKSVPDTQTGDDDTVVGCESGDGDEDGVCDDVDNCPATANADQEDADADGIGDACDTTPELDCEPGPGTSLAVETLTSDLERPVFITHANDGSDRLFVIEQPGRIRIIKEDAVVETPFLDITSVVDDSSNEEGLLGLAFHPDFANNSRFFVNYTAKDGSGTVIAEYKATGDVADAAETRVLSIAQPYSNHNGGMVAFGPDGFLYIGMGDGGSGGDPDEYGQDMTKLLGKILRIDIDSGSPYAIPSSNPFATGGGREEIWASGIRNPWRFSFDRTTGDLWIGDVGQNQIEEIDFQPASSTGGEDYGWNTYEGTACFDAPCEGDVVMPIVEYSHSGGACSVTGGYVYRGQCMPDLQGWYFYADYCSNDVWRLRQSGGTAAENIELDEFLGANISSFGEDQNGELYITALGGAVHRLVLQE